jgi:hypothetical protein
MIDPLNGRSDQGKPKINDERLAAEPPVAPVLGEIIEDITRRLQLGEAVMIEDYVQQNPDFERPIRRLFPALQLMSSLKAKTIENRLGNKIDGGG